MSTPEQKAAIAAVRDRIKSRLEGLPQDQCTKRVVRDVVLDVLRELESEGVLVPPPGMKVEDGALELLRTFGYRKGSL